MKRRTRSRLEWKNQRSEEVEAEEVARAAEGRPERMTRESWMKVQRVDEDLVEKYSDEHAYQVIWNKKMKIPK